MAGKHQSRDHEHLLSVPTYGPKRHTIVHRIAGRGIVTVATPLPDEGGWKILIIMPDGRYAVGEAPIGKRDEAKRQACAQLGIDPKSV
jgi:hypothetical protein